MDEDFRRHSSLPPEIITDILTRLPVKSLTRFESLSKGLSNLFKALNFITKHLHLSTQNDPSLFINCHSNKEIAHPGCYLLHIQSMNLKESHVPTIFNPSSLIHIVGSCNGLLCVKCCSEDYPFAILLWNPATRKIRKLPETQANELPYGGLISCSVGFGFSAQVNEYKVVVIHRVERDKGGSVQVEVYCLGSGSWKKVKSTDLLFVHFNFDGLAAGGALFWQGRELPPDSSNCPRWVVSFDLGKETFSKITPPSSDHKDEGKLVVYKDSIAILYEFVPIELWVMKNASDCGDCWSKLFVIEPFPALERPVGVWGNELLIEKKESNAADGFVNEEKLAQLFLSSFDGKKKKHLVSLPASYYSIFYNVLDYVESLVSV